MHFAPAICDSKVRYACSSNSVGLDRLCCRALIDLGASVMLSDYTNQRFPAERVATLHHHRCRRRYGPNVISCDHTNGARVCSSSRYERYKRSDKKLGCRRESGPLSATHIWLNFAAGRIQHAFLCRFTPNTVCLRRVAATAGLITLPVSAQASVQFVFGKLWRPQTMVLSLLRSYTVG